MYAIYAACESSDFLSDATLRKRPQLRPNLSNAPTTVDVLRSFTASLAPAEVKLSRCGSVIAPFGGHMLVTFEEHLRTFGNPISNTPSGKNTAIVEPRSGILARGGRERKGRN